MVILCFLITSCGYQKAGGDLETPLVLSIPLIWDDADGKLREHLAKRISSASRFSYTSSSNSRYQLIVKIEKDAADTIGYVWDQASLTGTRINRLYPSEGQRSITAKVHIQDTHSKKKVSEPFTVTVRSEYDFVNPTALQNIQFTDTSGHKQSTLQFSLGQLDSEEGAKIETFIPLFDNLALEITRSLIRIPLKL